MTMTHMQVAEIPWLSPLVPNGLGPIMKWCVDYTVPSDFPGSNTPTENGSDLHLWTHAA